MGLAFFSIWVYVTNEKKPCFIHHKNMLRVNYTTKNISEKPVTKLTFWNWVCKLNMVHKQYVVTKNAALETPVSWENWQWIFSNLVLLLTFWKCSGSTHDLSLSFVTGLTFMSLSVQIYICHFFRFMHFSMKRHAIQNCMPPKFNTKTKNARNWLIMSELCSNSHNKVCVNADLWTAERFLNKIQ